MAQKGFFTDFWANLDPVWCEQRAAYSRRQQGCSVLVYKLHVGAASDNLRDDLSSVTHRDSHHLTECSGWTAMGSALLATLLLTRGFKTSSPFQSNRDLSFWIIISLQDQKSLWALLNTRVKIPSNNFCFTMPLRHHRERNNMISGSKGASFHGKNQQT